MKKIMLLTVIFTTLFGCGNQTKKDVSDSNTSQQTIYYGGDIITMEGDGPE